MIFGKIFLLLKNPRHPSLQFTKIGVLWSARVGQARRDLATEDGEDFVWVWLGTHDEYEKMLRERGFTFRQTPLGRASDL